MATPTDVRPRTLTGRPAAVTRQEDTSEARAAWTRSRFDALRAIGLEPRVAIALVAHYARETGWGRSEWNYALGNIRWRGTGPAFYQRGGDDPEPRPYQAYNSLQDGARAAVEHASTGRYAAGFQALAGGGREVDWYLRLMVPAPGVGGWHPYSDTALDEYVSILDRARTNVGLPPAPQGAIPYYRGQLPTPPHTQPPASQNDSQSGSSSGVAFVVACVAVAAGIVFLSRSRR